MNDKELLEMAAKAHGNCKYFNDDWRCAETGYREFNPLGDDGDALRLLVKLKMDINIENDGVTVWYYAGFSDVEAISEDVVGGDFLSATRRAIALAAAEIGKSL